MDWFGISYKENPFQMFSGTHMFVLALFLFGAFMLFLFKRKLQVLPLRKVEIGVACSLIIFELAYHGWMFKNGIWHAYQSLPLELCNISLIFGILLLLTERKGIYDVFLFISLLGATQAVVTPLLDFNFPHFRFLHFFYTHITMIWIALYYTWVKGYYPTIRSVMKTVLFLNFLLPFILLVNHLTGGNYMFLNRKPKTASLLDYLGPYPWYIGSMEVLLIVLSVLIWIVFRKKQEEEKTSGEN
ncbi:TIGR02206 family membrane protein [Fervidibacillus halotolerans]|uniref:TIGR02206 family membrane protein n=1 Tax=Fervidibacillus halotolerans TaxID=2980027 RepID=A0A9E8RY99_9BACI|nr:TIGR02206 family membrane protein [Fervidibacillus halotolerans]WAA11999.1 TIGR02206 family membrane protein [Fervidibacillus halotolerans]